MQRLIAITLFASVLFGCCNMASNEPAVAQKPPRLYRYKVVCHIKFGDGNSYTRSSELADKFYVYYADRVLINERVYTLTFKDSPRRITIHTPDFVCVDDAGEGYSFVENK